MDITTIALVSTLFFILIGVPIWVAFVLGGAAVLLLDMGMPIETIAQFAFASFETYPLLAAPFFILSGALMVRSGGMEPLQILVSNTVYRIQGGLPILVIIVGAVLGAVSGSAAACLAILAAVILPLFAKGGLSRAYGAGVSLVSAELGLIIPPSIFLILFGASNQISIQDLFSGGLAAGVILTACMVPVAIWTSVRLKEKSEVNSDMFQWQDGGSLIKCLPLLFYPVIILGGIYGGIFSPTESASVAVFYSLFLGLFAYQKLTMAMFVQSLEDTVRLTALIYMLVFGADMLSRLLVYMEIPSGIAQLMLSLDLGPTAFLFAVTLFLLVVGLVFSSLPMVIMVIPLFLPTVISLGINPIYFGVIGVICASLGEITPPFGPQLWIAEPICDVPMSKILKQAAPFLLAWVVALMLMIIFPQMLLYPMEALR